ncbi:MAG: hypothetical protein Q4A93_06255 [Actinomycetota bacterium]|nr:hypothetical protein [Actinomycetota bacterium]
MSQRDAERRPEAQPQHSRQHDKAAERERSDSAARRMRSAAARRSSRDIDWSADPWEEDARREEAERKLRQRQEFGSDDSQDLPPMSFKQKLALFISILALVIVGYWLMHTLLF